MRTRRPEDTWKSRPGKSFHTEQLNHLISRQMLNGENATVARLLLKARRDRARHFHVGEQFSLILEGKLRFVFDDQEIVVGAGEILFIPANVPHSAVALEDTVDVDFFAPQQEGLDSQRGCVSAGRKRKSEPKSGFAWRVSALRLRKQEGPRRGNRSPASADESGLSAAAAAARTMRSLLWRRGIGDRVSADGIRADRRAGAFQPGTADEPCSPPSLPFGKRAD